MATSRVCSIPNCGKPHKASGLCEKHYMREYRIKRENDAPRRCIVEECNRAHSAGGYCSIHYKRMRHSGRLERIRANTDDRMRFAIEAAETKTDDCIFWPFGKLGNTYGQVTIHKASIQVHRYVCFLKHGQPTEDQTDCAHSCGNKRCINPRHLRWATRRENADDMLGHGSRLQGERHGQAKLTDEIARQIKNAKGNNGEIGRQCGVRRETVRDIRNGRRWRHV